MTVEPTDDWIARRRAADAKFLVSARAAAQRRAVSLAQRAAADAEFLACARAAEARAEARAAKWKRQVEKNESIQEDTVLPVPRFSLIERILRER